MLGATGAKNRNAISLEISRESVAGRRGRGGTGRPEHCRRSLIDPVRARHSVSTMRCSRRIPTVATSFPPCSSFGTEYGPGDNRCDMAVNVVLLHSHISCGARLPAVVGRREQWAEMGGGKHGASRSRPRSSSRAGPSFASVPNCSTHANDVKRRNDNDTQRGSY